MKRLIIIGAGGHAAELRDYIRTNNQNSECEVIEVLGFIDDDQRVYQHYDFDEPFLGSIKDHVVRKDCHYLMAIANLKYRRPIIEEFIRNGANLTGFIHPTAIISPSARIHPTVVVSHNASVGPKVRIGRFNMLNSRCTIGHDTQIGDFNFISPQVALSGNTKIGNGNLIGTNSATIPGVTIGDNNVVGAGTVLFRDIDNNKTVVPGTKPRTL